MRWSTHTGGGWRDALAAASVILPVSVLLVAVVWETQDLLAFPPPGPFAYGFPGWLVQSLAGPVALVVLAVLAVWMRRVAALAAAGLLIWFLSPLPTEGLGLAIGEACLFLTVGLEVVALAASPGPRRGLRILTWWHGVLVVVVTLASATAITMPLPARFIMLGVICAGMLLTSAMSRWLLVLLAIPGYPFFYGDPMTSPGSRIARTYLPPDVAIVAPLYAPALALMIVALVVIRRRRPQP